MKKILMLSFLTFSTSIFASEYTDFATVKKVEAQYSDVNQPFQTCSTQTVQDFIPGRQDRNYGGAVIGGVAGGILGNQVGKGHGREAATALGAVVGAITGDNLNRPNYSPPQVINRDVQNCYLEDNFVQQLENYKITYEYKGRLDVFYTKEKPKNNKIKINVNITPMIESYSSSPNYEERYQDRNERPYNKYHNYQR